MSLLLPIFSAFIVGFAMKKGGLCTYEATIQIIQQRTGERMSVFLGIAACATIAIVPLSWLFPERVSLSLTHDYTSIAIWGGLILGLGAYLNKGCMFGTFVQLVGGNSTYLATLIGLFIGVVITYQNFSIYIPYSNNLTSVTQPGLSAYLWLGVSLLFALWVISKIKFSQALLIILTLGAGGGLLSTTVNGWDYASVLTKVAHNFISSENSGPTTLAILCALSMIVGGIYASVSDGNFKFKKPTSLVFMANLIGGFLMGSAVIIIPGGNDGMLLKDIPSFAPHAIISYIFMVAAMLVLIAIFRKA